MRKRTGELVSKPWGFAARIRYVDANGKRVRKQVALNTKDPILARKKLDGLVRDLESGAIARDPVAAVEAPELVRDVWGEWIAERKARGVVMVNTEESYWNKHLSTLLGPTPVREVSKFQCRRVLDAVRAKGLSQGTVGHVRRLLVRFFGWLEENERIDSSPMRGVKSPRAKVDDRPRTLLRDEEYSALLAAPVDFTPSKKTGRPRTSEVEFFEMKLIAFTSRTLGGLRAGECVRWGPVFPVTRGDRKGQVRGRGTSLAKRKLKALARALTWAGMPLRHELFNDTPYSRRTDFHSGRREFVTGLAVSGASEQKAMRLANHHDSKVHQRYQLAQFKEVPVEALPKLALVVPLPSSPLPTHVPNGVAVSGDSVMISERDTGLEHDRASAGTINGSKSLEAKSGAKNVDEKAGSTSLAVRSTVPQPEATDGPDRAADAPDTALRAAIKAAVDAGQWERVQALRAVLRATTAVLPYPERER